jgi:hypothetical protein
MHTGLEQIYQAEHRLPGNSNLGRNLHSCHVAQANECSVMYQAVKFSFLPRAKQADAIRQAGVAAGLSSNSIIEYLSAVEAMILLSDCRR